MVQLVAGWIGRLQLQRLMADLRTVLPWLLLTLGVTAALFLRVLDGPEPYMLVLPAVLVWSAIRLKVRWMSLLLVLMNGVALYGTQTGLGPFGSETPLRTSIAIATRCAFCACCSAMKGVSSSGGRLSTQ